MTEAVVNQHCLCIGPQPRGAAGHFGPGKNSSQLEASKMMKKTTTKAALTIIALLTMLVFAVPSFADTIWVDFQGNGKQGGGKQSTFVYKDFQITAEYLPLASPVAANNLDSIAVTYPSPAVTNAYLSYSLNTSTHKGTMTVFSGTGDKWFIADVTDFRFGLKPGTTEYDIDLFSGSIKMTTGGNNLLRGAGIPIPVDPQFYSQSHSYVTLNKDKLVTAVDDNMAFTYKAPEPMTAALILPGLAFLGFVRRRFLA